MDYRSLFSSRKLKKGFCYPLKPDVLFDFLNKFKVTNLYRIHYGLRTSNNTIFSAQYYGEVERKYIKSDQCYYYLGSSEIIGYSIPLQEKKLAGELIIKDVIPVLCEWLKEIETQNEYWKLKDHNIIFQYNNGKMTIHKDEKRSHWVGPKL